MVAATKDQTFASSDAGLLLRTHELVICVFATLAMALLVVHGRQIQGWGHAAFNFGLIAASPVIARLLEQRWPSATTRFLAAFVPPSMGVIFFYTNLDPLCDLLNPHLADAKLAAVDARLFGVYPAVWLERVVPPLVNELLLLCYTSYYFWPVGIGLILYSAGRMREFNRFVLGYVLVMFATYVGYMLVPAIGPRFYLAGEFAGPLKGVWLTPVLDRMFRASPYFRDCFPSGHTALTLFCLLSARRYTPRFFKVMLVPGLGLIAATLVCRFHYAIDLICAPAATAFAFAAAAALQRKVPDVRLPTRVAELRPAERH